jgi:ubiquitin-large subunit ribosomal protein L40e
MSQEVVANVNANADVVPMDQVAKNDEGIYIKTLTGKSIHISYSPDMTIQSIKQQISELEQIPIEQQRLIFSGKQLEDDKTLGFHNIPAGSTIHLVLRLRGGF